MPTFPIYNFSISSLDYADVQYTIKQMHTYLSEKVYSEKDLLQHSYTRTVLQSVNPILTAMKYNSPIDLNNTERWKTNCACAYKILYPLTTN